MKYLFTIWLALACLTLHSQVAIDSVQFNGVTAISNITSTGVNEWSVRLSQWEGGYNFDGSQWGLDSLADNDYIFVNCVPYLVTNVIPITPTLADVTVQANYDIPPPLLFSATAAVFRLTDSTALPAAIKVAVNPGESGIQPIDQVCLENWLRAEIEGVGGGGGVIDTLPPVLNQPASPVDTNYLWRPLNQRLLLYDARTETWDTIKFENDLIVASDLTKAYAVVDEVYRTSEGEYRISYDSIAGYPVDGYAKVETQNGLYALLDPRTASIEAYGAVADDGNSDAAAILRMRDYAGRVEFTDGTYRLDTSITLTCDVIFQPNALLSIDTLKTLNVKAASIVAPERQIFTGPGNISAKGEVLVDWFGAKPDCVDSVQVVEDYVPTETWRVDEVNATNDQIIIMGEDDGIGINADITDRMVAGTTIYLTGFQQAGLSGLNGAYTVASSSFAGGEYTGKTTITVSEDITLNYVATSVGKANRLGRMFWEAEGDGTTRKYRLDAHRGNIKSLTITWTSGATGHSMTTLPIAYEDNLSAYSIVGDLEFSESDRSTYADTAYVVWTTGHVDVRFNVPPDDGTEILLDYTREYPACPTDSHEGIQKAIDSGAEVVELGKGTYGVSTTVVYRDDLEFKGQGKNLSWLQSTRLQVDNFDVFGNGRGASNDSNFVEKQRMFFHDFGIIGAVGNIPMRPDTLATYLTSTTASNHNIMLGNSKNVKIDNITSKVSWRDPLYIGIAGKPSRYIKITNSDFLWGGRASMAATSSSNVIVSGNVFAFDSKMTKMLDNRTIYVVANNTDNLDFETNSDADPCEDILFENNQVIGSWKTGIALQPRRGANARNIVVSGNTFYGIDTLKWAFSGNRLSTSIRIKSSTAKGFTIMGNTSADAGPFRVNGSDGIWLGNYYRKTVVPQLNEPMFILDNSSTAPHLMAYNIADGQDVFGSEVINSIKDQDYRGLTVFGNRSTIREEGEDLVSSDIGNAQASYSYRARAANGQYSPIIAFDGIFNTKNIGLYNGQRLHYTPTSPAVADSTWSVVGASSYFIDRGAAGTNVGDRFLIPIEPGQAYTLTLIAYNENGWPDDGGNYRFSQLDSSAVTIGGTTEPFTGANYNQSTWGVGTIREYSFFFTSESNARFIELRLAHASSTSTPAGKTNIGSVALYKGEQSISLLPGLPWVKPSAQVNGFAITGMALNAGLDELVISATVDTTVVDTNDVWTVIQTGVTDLDGVWARVKTRDASSITLEVDDALVDLGSYTSGGYVGPLGTVSIKSSSIELLGRGNIDVTDGLSRNRRTKDIRTRNITADTAFVATVEAGNVNADTVNAIIPYDPTGTSLPGTVTNLKIAVDTLAGRSGGSAASFILQTRGQLFSLGVVPEGTRYTITGQNGAVYAVYDTAFTKGGSGFLAGIDSVFQIPTAGGQVAHLQPYRGAWLWSHADSTGIEDYVTMRKATNFMTRHPSGATLFIDAIQIWMTDTVILPANFIIEGNYNGGSTYAVDMKSEIILDLNDSLKTAFRWNTNSPGGYLKGTGFRNVVFSAVSKARAAVETNENMNTVMQKFMISGNRGGITAPVPDTTNRLLQYGLVMKGGIQSNFDDFRIENCSEACLLVQRATSFGTTTSQLRNGYFREAPIGILVDNAAGSLNLFYTILENIDSIGADIRGGRFRVYAGYSENVPKADPWRLDFPGTDFYPKSGSVYQVGSEDNDAQLNVYGQNFNGYQAPGDTTATIRVINSESVYVTGAQFGTAPYVLQTYEKAYKVIFDNCYEYNILNPLSKPPRTGLAKIYDQRRVDIRGLFDHEFDFSDVYDYNTFRNMIIWDSIFMKGIIDTSGAITVPSALFLNKLENVDHGMTLALAKDGYMLMDTIKAKHILLDAAGFSGADNPQAALDILSENQPKNYFIEVNTNPSDPDTLLAPMTPAHVSFDGGVRTNKTRQFNFAVGDSAVQVTDSTLVVSGEYYVQATVRVAASGGFANVGGWLYKNGVQIGRTFTSHFLRLQGEQAELSFYMVEDLSEGDSITLLLQTDKNVDLYVYSAVLSMELLNVNSRYEYDIDATLDSILFDFDPSYQVVDQYGPDGTHRAKGWYDRNANGERIIMTGEATDDYTLKPESQDNIFNGRHGIKQRGDANTKMNISHSPIADIKTLIAVVKPDIGSDPRFMLFSGDTTSANIYHARSAGAETDVFVNVGNPRTRINGREYASSFFTTSAIAYNEITRDPVSVVIFDQLNFIDPHWVKNLQLGGRESTVTYRYSGWWGKVIGLQDTLTVGERDSLERYLRNIYVETNINGSESGTFTTGGTLPDLTVQIAADTTIYDQDVVVEDVTFTQANEQGTLNDELAQTKPENTAIHVFTNPTDPDTLLSTSTLQYVSFDAGYVNDNTLLYDFVVGDSAVTITDFAQILTGRYSVQVDLIGRFDSLPNTITGWILRNDTALAQSYRSVAMDLSGGPFEMTLRSSLELAAGDSLTVGIQTAAGDDVVIYSASMTITLEEVLTKETFKISDIDSITWDLNPRIGLFTQEATDSVIVWNSSGPADRTLVLQGGEGQIGTTSEYPLLVGNYFNGLPGVHHDIPATNNITKMWINGAFTGTNTVAMVIEMQSDGAYPLLGSNNVNRKILFADEGGSETDIWGDQPTTPTLWINGVLFTGTTRDDLYQAIPQNEPCVLVVEGVDFSTWDNVRMGMSTPGTTNFTSADVIWGRFLLMEDVLTTEERQKMESVLLRTYVNPSNVRDTAGVYDTGGMVLAAPNDRVSYVSLVDGSDLSITGIAMKGRNEWRVHISMTAGSSNSQILLPTPDWTMVGNKLFVFVDDNDGTWDGQLSAGTDEIWSAGTLTNSLSLSDGGSYIVTVGVDDAGNFKYFVKD